VTKKGLKYDSEIMQELLDQPSVKKSVVKMTPAELDMYMGLLVKRGVYARYASDRQNKQVKELFSNIRPSLSGFKKSIISVGKSAKNAIRRDRE